MNSPNALITGANRGIGLELTKLLVNSNYNVDCVCRSSSTDLEELSVTIFSDINLTHSQDLQHLKTKLQNNSYDLIINNAGMLSNETFDNFNAASKTRILDQFKLNSLAPLELSCLFSDQLKSPSKLIFITSRMGSITDNTSGSRYGYRMSKAALNMAATSLAHDLHAQGVVVGILHPGYVKTGMTNFNGNLTAQQAAQQLWQQIEALNMSSSGTFLHSDGSILPW